MTREEKARAYDKALEKAKNEINAKGIGDTVDLCKHLFPELRESDDERIRKEILEYLKLVDKGEDDHAHPMVSKWIAYLEKQKDAFENGCQFGIMQEQARQELELLDEKQKEFPLTDKAFKEQLERVLRNNVLDVDIRITGDTVIGAKINPEDKGLFLRSLSDEAILKECKERGLDVKYSEEENLAYRLNWVMQDYYKAGEDEEEREHRLKCYQLFWDALADENFFEQKEQKPIVEYHYAKFREGDKIQKITGDKDIVTIAEVDVEAEEYRLTNSGFIPFEYEHLWHIAEQKPAEWSKEDEIRLKEALEVLNESIKHLPFGYGYTKDVRLVTDWLKSLPERFNLQPKQEWSDEHLKR